MNLAQRVEPHRFWLVSSSEISMPAISSDGSRSTSATPTSPRAIRRFSSARASLIRFACSRARMFWRPLDRPLVLADVAEFSTLIFLPSPMFTGHTSQQFRHGRSLLPPAIRAHKTARPPAGFDHASLMDGPLATRAGLPAPGSFPTGCPTCGRLRPCRSDHHTQDCFDFVTRAF